MASVRQVAANRENGLKGGVKTEEGKAVSRLNARRSALSSRPMGKHSIFVTALTEEDSEEVRGYEDELIATLRPAGRVEEMLVEKVALTWLRMQRCARAEAEYHGQTWGDPDKVPSEYRGWDCSRKRRRYEATGMCFNEQAFERMVKLIDLYDTRLTNQFLKLLHEIERMQLLRKGKDALPDMAQPALFEPKPQSRRPAVQNDVPAQSETSAPAPEPPPAVDELGADGVARPPLFEPEPQSRRPAVHNDLSTESQPRAAVPHTEEVPTAALEQSQDVRGQGGSA